MATKASTKRSAKTPLDREAYVAAALKLASRQTTTNLTFRELGTAMGVDPTAIYRHFLNKDSLMQELLDRAFKMALQRLQTPVEQWEQCLEEFAVHTLDVFLEHPAIAASATVLTTSGQGELDSIELMLSCFAQSGLEGRALAEQYAIFGSYVLSGAASLAISHVEASDPEGREWFSGPLLADPRSTPLVSSLRNEILELDHREIFISGARQIIQAARG
ncbi:hypothetical protein AUR04nite_15140 [Glutamicibacter uratoxydans]|uniref:HTH tetR-type domain-containing protein n=1 Tax=Glutamicibacter uratoxydans TaxID=43667 RepID=A0A4Y4DKZ2_GLUUR|nr:TetR/AcrR family transcriptional regulator [Glutamicibacter uratoxydans]GED05982.1 hypothetical protein AUR04nite_15140 [Glutamicibacter uratoxydans]